MSNKLDAAAQSFGGGVDDSGATVPVVSTIHTHGGSPGPPAFSMLSDGASRSRVPRRIHKRNRVKSAHGHFLHRERCSIIRWAP
jgi:hypothetical protein